MSSGAPIYLCHSHEDTSWLRAFVGELRRVGADLWVDERGASWDACDTELRARPTLILLLSRAAVASQWVRDEMRTAIQLRDEDAQRVIFSVLAQPCAIPLEWSGYPRMSGPGGAGIAPVEAAQRVGLVLGIGPAASLPLAMAGATPTPTPTGSATPTPLPPLTPPLTPMSTPPPVAPNAANVAAAAEAYRYGAMLYGQNRFAEALAACERATALAPNMVDAWVLRGNALLQFRQFAKALFMYNQALALDPWQELAWTGKAIALKNLGRDQEAGDAAKSAQISAGVKRRPS